jgi:hypothetical protein
LVINIPFSCFTYPYPVDVFTNATPIAEQISHSFNFWSAFKKSFSKITFKGITPFQVKFGANSIEPE